MWLMVTVSAFGVLARYSGTPGSNVSTTSGWPADSGLELDLHRHTLVMLAHPRCGCTHASLRELERLLAATAAPVRAYVLFIRPAGVGDDWSDTELVRRARSMLGVEVVTDDDGLEAARFGAATSGHVVLYAPGGALLYSGGITPSRGHEGDSTGNTAIKQLLTHGAAVERTAFTFGCDLFGGTEE